MNYYDEEIIISSTDSKHLSSVKIDKLSNGQNSALQTAAGNASSSNTSMFANRVEHGQHQRTLLHGSSMDDDGLLQDIIDHDDVADDSDDDSELEPTLVNAPSHMNQRRSATQKQHTTRPHTRPGSTRGAAGLTASKRVDNDTEASDIEDADVMQKKKQQTRNSFSATTHETKTSDSVQLNLTPDMWEQLPLHQEVKDLFPYILKYTPQIIEIPYHLQPFIPEYVPAVGDVDAFLKVNTPPLLQQQHAQEINEHVSRLGIYLLDEPSGTQSEPSLLNMKLRSVLTGGMGGSGANKRSTSATFIPTAKSPKDIDKWIAEVEQVHMTQSVYEAQPRKDVDALVAEWPRAYANVDNFAETAYQQYLKEQITLTEYVHSLSQCFEIEGKLETQMDYIRNVQTLFALYLAANQAWE